MEMMLVMQTRVRSFGRSHVIIIVINLSMVSCALMKSMTYKMMYNSTGNPLCSIDKPSTVISMGASTMGMQCGVQCTVASSCKLFQFRADSTLCELYSQLPSNYTSGIQCTAYAVAQGTLYSAHI